MSERRRPGEILEASIPNLYGKDRATFLSAPKKHVRAADDVRTLRGLKDRHAIQRGLAASMAPTR